MSKPVARDFDDYAARFTDDVKRQLQTLRQAIEQAVPDATETIHYGIPAFRLDGIVVWFAAHAGHIGFYPGASAVAKFEAELATYKLGRGSIQFPLAERLPLELIARMVTYRVREQRSQKQRATSRPPRTLPHKNA